MQEEKVRFDVLLKRALELGEAALAELDKSDVYVEGRVKILNQPEFADAEKMRSIFSAFEEKSKLLKLLDKSLQAAGMSIYIGSENEIDEIKEFSLVASNYQMGSRVIGTLGVLGPTRMNYSRVIPVVDYVSELVSEFLEA
jgi:heat-inducible transcriptional repressor